MGTTSPDNEGASKVKLGKKMPGWILIFAVLITAGLTTLVIYKFGDSDIFQENLDFFTDMDHAEGILLPGPAALSNHFRGNEQAKRPGQQTAPVIFNRSVQPPGHGDRGSCTSCHTVVNYNGSPVIAIGALSQRPHEMRGVCTNCHQIIPGIFSKQTQASLNPNQSNSLSQSPQGAQCPPGLGSPSYLGVHTANNNQPITPPQNFNYPQMGNQANTRAQNTRQNPPPVEAEWMGLEVSPITKTTASQYNIPLSTHGLLVPEAEAQAAKVGIKAGDVVVAINGVPTYTVTDFFHATKNGTLSEGNVEVLRQGRTIGFRLSQNGTQATAPTTARRQQLRQLRPIQTQPGPSQINQQQNCFPPLQSQVQQPQQMNENRHQQVQQVQQGQQGQQINQLMIPPNPTPTLEGERNINSNTPVMGLTNRNGTGAQPCPRIL